MLGYLYNFITASWDFLYKSIFNTEPQNIEIRKVDESLLITSDEEDDVE